MSNLVENNYLDGGGLQGTVLGMFLFLILINRAGFSDIPMKTGETICNPSVNKRKPMRNIHLKWVDDMTVAECINLKDSLVETTTHVHPVQFHERTGHSLPEASSSIQELLNELLVYSESNQMKINSQKTMAILFNKSKKYDFLPQLRIGDSDPLKVVEELKLLGVLVSSDLSWAANTRAMCSKAYSRLWILRRLKPLGVSQLELLDVYEKQIRCILEYASPVWTGGLTKNEVNQIERVQKAAFAIILGNQYTSYAKALDTLKRPSLETRRKDINTRFAKKCLSSQKFSHWFTRNTRNTSNMQTRSKMHPLLMKVQSRTKAFEKSPLAYLTQLLVDNQIS